MCELGVILTFLENDLSKIVKILAGLMFQGFIQNSVFPFTLDVFLLDRMFTTTILFVRVDMSRRGRFMNSAFPKKKTFAQKSKFI